MKRAERAVESKNVDVARDIAPLLDALKRSKDTDEKRELVDAISDLGEEDGDSPNSVKQYLMQNAPPVLLEVAKTGKNAFLQGDAITALREMGCSRAILEQAAAIAEADPDSFVQSRGEMSCVELTATDAWSSSVATLLLGVESGSDSFCAVTCAELVMEPTCETVATIVRVAFAPEFSPPMFHNPVACV